MSLPIKGVFRIVVDVLDAVLRHDMAVTVASVLQQVELVTELVLRVLTRYGVPKNSARTAPDVAGPVDVVTGGRLQRVRRVGGVDVDTVGAVVSVEGGVIGRWDKGVARMV